MSCNTLYIIHYSIKCLTLFPTFINLQHILLVCFLSLYMFVMKYLWWTNSSCACQWIYSTRGSTLNQRCTIKSTLHCNNQVNAAVYKVITAQLDVNLKTSTQLNRPFFSLTLSRMDQSCWQYQNSRSAFWRDTTHLSRRAKDSTGLLKYGVGVL
jgi:hypothetical protein